MMDIPKGMRLRFLQRHLHTHVYCSTIHNSQVMEAAKIPHHWQNRLRKCGIYTQWNFTQPWRRTKSCHSQVNGWNWRTSSKAKLARLRKPKIVCSPSYADFTSKTNAVILLDLGLTLRGEHIQEEQGKVGNPKLERVWCAHCRGANTVTLKWQRSIWEGGQEVVKRSGRDESIWVVIHLCMEAMLGMSLYS
jgi:hypothetical protein